MKNKIPILVVTIILIIGGLLIYQSNKNKQNLMNMTTNDIDTNINTDDGDEDVDWSNYDEKDVSTNESISITESGTYNLSGNITGNVTINTSGNVKLVLNNVNIKSSNGPAIIVEQAENVVIHLTEGTTNTLEDTSDYNFDDTDINGVIYSKDDLTIEGTGNLVIKSNYGDGIVSKDDLKITNGNYNITSVDDGIRGKDSIYIMNGNFNINSGGDALKSTNNTDTEKGYILIENGNFEIDADLDGMQAETKLVIQNGTFDIKTGGGSSNASTNNDWGNWGGYYGYSNTDTESAKGLKSQDNLVIENGTFTFDTSDDAIHSNNYFGLKQGNITISSGDDGIHADTEIIIDGGTINITKSYEGIEAGKITINDGDINLTASDDGINIAGGTDSSAMGRPGENNYNQNTNNMLVINGGNIYVNATGDGIDVNGSAYVYGGNISVDGPTNDGNGSLDYDREFVVDGGTFIAAGSNGMLQSISSTKQCNVIVSFNNNYSANTKVSIVDSNGNEIIAYTPSKSFSSIIISSSLLTKNTTYKIVVNGNTYQSFTTNSLSTTIGNITGGFNNMMGPRR